MQLVVLAIVILDVLSAIYLVNWGPFPLAAELGAPTAYLNIYVHVPAGVAMYVTASLAFASALVSIRRQSAVKVMDSSAYITAALAWYAFISGTIWAAESWGTPLALDPRQMSILTVAVVFSLYPAIRRGVEDPDRSVKLSQSYLIAGYVLVVISLLAPVLVEAFHPKPGATFGGTLRAYMGLRTVLVVALFTVLIFTRAPKPTLWLYLTAAVVVSAMLYPWLQNPVRVIDVTNNSIVLEDGRVLNIPPQSVLTPVEINGVATLPKHYILVSKDGVELVRHYSAYVNAALYFLTAAVVARRHE